MMPRTLEFFYDHSSPYSYLASTQLEALARRTGAEIVWRPFLLGAVFKATQNAGPISIPAKFMYLAKDLGDWTRHYGLPDISLPEDWPINSLRSNRVSLVAQEEGKLVPFSLRVLRALFGEGKDTSSVEVISNILKEVGLEPESCLARAESQPIKDRLRQNTDEAVSRGAFGAPTFFIGDDMYVGNDRLQFVEKALLR
jgi:2-hydroxychromene-2-carboxylate isomerase